VTAPAPSNVRYAHEARAKCRACGREVALLSTTEHRGLVYSRHFKPLPVELVHGCRVFAISGFCPGSLREASPREQK
jgi:hypothetical protein